jgi:mycothiol synthase
MNKPQQSNWNLRPATMDDLDGVCDVINAYSLDLLGVGADNRKYVILTWEQPGFSVETDTRVAVTPEGRIVGYAEVEDTEEPHVCVMSWVRVHPDYRNSSLGVQLVSWISERADDAIALAPDGARVSVSMGLPNEDVEMSKDLDAQGFRVVRCFLRMSIEFPEFLPAPGWPEDVLVRPFELDNDLEATVHAIREAFQDHWGHIEVPFEEELEKWRHWFQNDSDFDESLSSLALVDGRIVGFSMCGLRHPEDPSMGLINSLGVQREWRRRGLATALLHRSFNELKSRGQRRACLGVDAESLTGAFRVYEAAGMKADRQHNAYEKELRAGIDLSLKTLDSGQEAS